MEPMKAHRSMPRARDLRREQEINRLCEKNRRKCNSLTDAQREDLLQIGMQMIYGGSGKARVRHAGGR